jgi:hypothetical protein
VGEPDNTLSVYAGLVETRNIPDYPLQEHNTVSVLLADTFPTFVQLHSVALTLLSLLFKDLSASKMGSTECRMAGHLNLLHLSSTIQAFSNMDIHLDSQKWSRL